MNLSTITTRAALGIDAPKVQVEVHMANGLPSLSMVGLPEAAVKESKDRVRAALLSSHFEFPARRITINLAPADLPKEGGRFDLPIALGILMASGQLPPESLANVECIGELGLDGTIRPVSGVLPVAMQAARAGRNLILPRANLAEASHISGLSLFPAEHLLSLTQALHTNQLQAETDTHGPISPTGSLDLADVKGQAQAKRALEIAACGQHNLLFLGPPGTGKSMLAQRLPSILPRLDETEALETAALQSISAQGFHSEQWGQRPFRSPHHTASGVALVGGGSHPRPGEISLAHNGVLFLDELPEFDRRVLDVLREPLETGHIHIARAARQADFPARFQLIAAMNPCPCGYLGSASGRCHCSPEQVQRYQGRVSGPFMDRIDLHVNVLEQDPGLMWQTHKEESSARVLDRVSRARETQRSRQGISNAHLTGDALREHCHLGEAEQSLLKQAVTQLGLSARAHDRILRVARSIADLDGAGKINNSHLGEAISYRRLDRQTQK